MFTITFFKIIPNCKSYKIAGLTISEFHFIQIINTIIHKDQEFERLILTKEEALTMFQDNPFKLNIINAKDLFLT